MNAQKVLEIRIAEMAQRLRARTSVGKDPSLIPSKHIMQLMTARNSSSKESHISGLSRSIPIYPHISITVNIFF